MAIELDEKKASDLRSLYSYFVRASGIHEDFKRVSKEKLFPETGAFGELATAMETTNRLSVFYGLMYVVVEGYEECGFRDAKLDALLASPHLVVLKRYRNAIFHFQRNFHSSEKILDLLESDPIVPWLRSLWKELHRWFSDEVLPPMFEMMAADIGVDAEGLKSTVVALTKKS